MGERQAGRPHISKRVAVVARIYFSTDARASRRRRSAAATATDKRNETDERRNDSEKIRKKLHWKFVNARAE